MDYAIETKALTYKFSSSGRIGLQDITIAIPWGTTNLLLGPNGAGKSTLLKILAGKTLIKEGSLKIGGFDPFKFSINRNQEHNADINEKITYLGAEWASNPVVKRDIPVNLLISSVGGDSYPERRDELIEIMDLDPEWSMAYISDGERRRVQLVMGLLKPWKLLLLDEVTVDLDVVVRSKLLSFLKNECETRNCCVIYATHIFDGLGKDWCNKIYHIDNGYLKHEVDINDVEFVRGQLQGTDVSIESKKRVLIEYVESLHPLALHWLYDDLRERGTREDAERK